jgi:tRNA(fMet)-specific endonuclease VapC
MILLDTNVVIAITNSRPEKVRLRFEMELSRGASIAVSSIAVFELRYGASKSTKPVFNHKVLDEFLAGYAEILDFSSDDAAEAGNIRAALEARGTPIGPYDTLIAAQALRHNATLITANTREFARVAGLRLDDWTT